MSRLEISIWLSILLLAVALRLYDIQSIPPGLQFDEAANGVDALHVLDGEHPIFFEGNTGREPFFIYLMAAVFRALGASTTTIRFTGVLVGLAVVVATYLMARALLGPRKGLLVMLALAVSYWHISLSRLGLRAGSLPLFEATAIFLLWQGLKRQQLRWFALAGIAVGASLYTYTAARVFPVWLSIFVLIVGACKSLRPGFSTRRYLVMAGAFVLAATVTFAPLGIDFLKDSGHFWYRSSGVSVIEATPPGSDVGMGLRESVLNTLGMFFITGDLDAKNNLPGRPIFDLVQAAGFILGLLMLIRLWKERESLLLLLWLPFALLPGALSLAAPHYLRTAGLIPGVFVVEVIGLTAAADALISFVHRHKGPVDRYLPTLAATAVLLFGGLMATLDYFQRWAPSAAAYEGFRADLTDATNLIRQVPEGAPLLVSLCSTYREVPVPLNFYPLSRPDMRIFNGKQGVLVPPSTDGALFYVVPRSCSYIPDAGAREARFPIKGAERLATIAGPDGPSAMLYRVAQPHLKALVPEYKLDLRISDNYFVLGYDMRRRVTAGESVDIALYWRQIKPPSTPGTWQIYAHLATADMAHSISADYNDSLLGGHVNPDDLYISWLSLKTPETIAPGVYPVLLGVLGSETTQRPPLFDGQGREIGQSLALLPARVVGPQQAVNPEQPHEAAFADSVRLLGYKVGLDPDARGAQISLYWTADAPPHFDYTVFVHLLDQNGTLIAQQDNQPRHGQLPTSLWGRGDRVLDEYHLPLPVQSDGLRLAIGLYRADTGTRLPLLDAQGISVGDHLSLPLQAETSR